MAAGDHLGCADLMRATIPATWGQAIEVPDFIANLLPSDGGTAAKMSTPGAAMSGYPSPNQHIIQTQIKVTLVK